MPPKHRLPPGQQAGLVPILPGASARLQFRQRVKEVTMRHRSACFRSSLQYLPDAPHERLFHSRSLPPLLSASALGSLKPVPASRLWRPSLIFGTASGVYARVRDTPATLPDVSWLTSGPVCGMPAMPRRFRSTEALETLPDVGGDSARLQCGLCIHIMPPNGKRLHFIGWIAHDEHMALARGEKSYMRGSLNCSLTGNAH